MQFALLAPVSPAIGRETLRPSFHSKLLVLSETDLPEFCRAA